MNVGTNLYSEQQQCALGFGNLLYVDLKQLWQVPSKKKHMWDTVPCPYQDKPKEITKMGWDQHSRTASPNDFNDMLPFYHQLYKYGCSK